MATLVPRWAYKFLILGLNFRSEKLYEESVYCMGGFQKTTYTFCLLVVARQ